MKCRTDGTNICRTVTNSARGIDTLGQLYSHDERVAGARNSSSFSPAACVLFFPRNFLAITTARRLRLKSRGQSSAIAETHYCVIKTSRPRPRVSDGAREGARRLVARCNEKRAHTLARHTPVNKAAHNHPSASHSALIYLAFHIS